MTTYEDFADVPIIYTGDWIDAAWLNQYLGDNFRAVKDGIDGLLSISYPVGSVYISTVSTNPATLFGFGTWTAFGTGRTLVGYDASQTEFDTVEETGGEKTHTLTESEMPVHTHVQNAHNHTQNPHNHTIAFQNLANTGGSSGDRAYLGTSNTSNTTATNNAATATNQNAGGDGAHNNLQPYIVVYMFKRTA